MECLYTKDRKLYPVPTSGITIIHKPLSKEQER